MRPHFINNSIMYLTTCFALLIAISFGCADDGSDSYNVIVDKNELNFTSGSVSREFKITSTGEWYIEADGLSVIYGTSRGEADWYSVEPLGGSEGATVTVTSKENTDIEAGNTATLKIIGKNNWENVTLKQDAAETE